MSLADVQGSDVTLGKVVVQALIGAAKSLEPLCSVANAADYAHTTWAQILNEGVELQTKHMLIERMNAVMLALGKKLFDALPEQQKQAFSAAARAMDPNGNLLEDFDGNPLALTDDALTRLDKIAVSPVGDLIEKAERLFKMFHLRGEGRETVLREVKVEMVIDALNELRVALARMTPWRLRRPQ